MYLRPRFPLLRSIVLTRHTIAITATYTFVACAVHYFLKWDWVALPWQPISLIGTALAFYLGFKNNSSYDRLWEARKIWGGIVNTSRAFAVMARDFIIIDGDEAKSERLSKEIVQRHIAWLHMLTVELRKITQWEHQGKLSTNNRTMFGTHVGAGDAAAVLAGRVASDEADYILGKGNRSSHLLSRQSKRLMALRTDGSLEHFRHLTMQQQLTEMYTLQGKCERIKKFPFPRQYASATYFIILIFFLILPFGMIDVFASRMPAHMVFLAVPTTVLCAWIYWFMDRIGEYSENPFEGLINDVPIKSMARSIEIDILQMLDETDLPEPIAPFQNTFSF